MFRRLASFVLSLMAMGTALPLASAKSPVTPSVTDGTRPESGSKLTKEERAHVRRIVREGKADGLTRDQIRAKVRAYLRSIGKVPPKHAPRTGGDGAK